MKDPAYYDELFQKIDSSTATPEEIKEQKEMMEIMDDATPLLLEEMFMNMGKISRLKHFILGTYCLYKACEGHNCTDMLIDGMKGLGDILEKSHKNKI